MVSQNPTTNWKSHIVGYLEEQHMNQIFGIEKNTSMSSGFSALLIGKISFVVFQLFKEL